MWPLDQVPSLASVQGRLWEPPAPAIKWTGRCLLYVLQTPAIYVLVCFGTEFK